MTGQQPHHKQPEGIKYTNASQISFVVAWLSHRRERLMADQQRFYMHRNFRVSAQAESSITLSEQIQMVREEKLL